jgi:hypothetical protein
MLPRPLLAVNPILTPLLLLLLQVFIAGRTSTITNPLSKPSSSSVKHSALLLRQSLLPLLAVPLLYLQQLLPGRFLRFMFSCHPRSRFPLGGRLDFILTFKTRSDRFWVSLLTFPLSFFSLKLFPIRRDIRLLSCLGMRFFLFLSLSL